MIKGYCRTNLDNYRLENWPKSFVAVPREGDWVQSESGKILRVCKVTHKMTKVQNYDGSSVRESEPEIEVELTVTCSSKF